jgi:excisionase family DNA binding protein
MSQGAMFMHEHNVNPQVISKNLPRLIAIKQATYEIGIGRTVIYELIKDGRLKTVKIGRRRLVPVEAIEELVASLRKEGGEHDD